MRRPLIAIPLAVALGGCATSAAQRAFDDGDDVTAAKLADDATEANPHDGAALALRKRAREHAAKRELAETTGLRASGHAEAALASLDRLLTQLSNWGGPDVLPADLRAAIDAELEATRPFVAAIGAREATAGRPLAAETEIARLAPFVAHAELAAAASQSEARAHDAGQAACARLQTTVTPETPHWGLVVSRYCDHFGVVYAAPPLTNAIAKLDLSGGLVGTTPAQADELSARVSEWFTTSLWHEPLGQLSAHADVHGKVESSFRDQSVTLHAPYRDTLVTSSYGSGTVGTRNINVSGMGVTRVDRVYEYDAEEHRGTYDLLATISLNIAAGPSDGAPVTFTLRRAESLKAYEHDVSFPKAHVQPVHENVPSTDEWLRTQLDRLSTRVVLFLNRKFVTLVCTPSPAALEPAARCALAGQKPPAALATLGSALGEDAQRLMPVIAPPPPPPTVARAPARPVRAPLPHVTTDAEDPSVDLSE